MLRYLLAIAACLVLAVPSFAHHGIAVRRTPFRPFVGPVAVRNHHAPVVAFRHHAFVAPLAFRGYYTPAAFYAPAPVVAYSAPAPVVTYSQPAAVVSGYSAYQSYSAPQALSSQVYVLPDGRVVLPDGRVILQ